jgi:hypothetical protein
MTDTLSSPSARPRSGAPSSDALAALVAVTVVLVALAALMTIASRTTVTYGSSRPAIVEGATHAGPGSYRVLRVAKTDALTRLVGGGVPVIDRPATLGAPESTAGAVDTAAVTDAAWYAISSRGGISTNMAALVPTLLVPTNEVGESSGLIHALALIDAATGGDLTGGKIVAGTGAVTADGAVTQIGGLRHKLAAAAADGATLALVPASQLPEALAVAPVGLEVIGVDTVMAAIDELCFRGASSPLCH